MFNLKERKKMKKTKGKYLKPEMKIFGMMGEFVMAANSGEPPFPTPAKGNNIFGEEDDGDEAPNKK